MGGKIWWLGKSLITIGIFAHKGFLACVSSHVSFQVKIQRESFETNLTLVVSFFCMDQPMSFKLRFVQEFFVASIDSANELFFLVNNEMFSQFVNVFKDFITAFVFARETLLRWDNLRCCFFLYLCQWSVFFVFYYDLNPPSYPNRIISTRALLS